MENKTFSPCPYCDGRNENCADCELQSFRALGTVEELAANAAGGGAGYQICTFRHPRYNYTLTSGQSRGRK